MTLRFAANERVSAVVLEEDIAQGQRIDEAVIYALTEAGEESEIGRVHSVGYRRILTLPSPVEARALRVAVVASRQGFHLADAYAVRA